MPTPVAELAPAAPRHFRADIEGLRAVAVALVVFDHLWGAPTGGFVGVDVFYVISGFLITGLLLREYAKTGTVSFVKFYARRVRRIAPVAVVVLVVTVLVAYLLWYRTRADQTASDAIAAALFVSNWHFIRLGTDYLQAAGPISPLQHYWSLAVEEQFYIFWPSCLLLVLWICGRLRLTPGPTRVVVVWFVVAVIATSFAWSCYLSVTRPSFAYFDSLTRAWELGVGALMAVVTSRHSTGVRSASTVVLGAVVMLVASTFLITPASTFPGPWAAVSVSCAAAIVFFGGSTNSWSRFALTNPISRYVGRISYSLYLWHFPVIIFMSSMRPAITVGTSIAVVALMLALSALSYHFVEEPVRRSTFLNSVTRRKFGRSQILLPMTVAVVVVFMAVIQYLGPAAVFNGRVLASAVGLAPSSPTVPLQPYRSIAALDSALAGAAASARWPDLSPSLDELDQNDGAPEMNQQTGCRNDVTSTSTTYCDYGSPSASRTAVVIGDSVGASWMPSVVSALAPQGWRVRGLTYASCAIADVDAYPRVRTSTFLQQCDRARTKMLAWAASSGADLVVISDDEGTFTRLASGAQGDNAARAWQSGMSAALGHLGGMTARTVILSNPVLGGDPASCATRVTGPAACLTRVTSAYDFKAEAERKAASAAGAQFVDTRQWFCAASGWCPSYAGSTVLRIDSTHLTDRFGQELGPLLKEALLGK